MSVSLKNPNPKALVKAANHRRDDAKELRQAKRWRGAMYLLGYEVEFRLKARLMELHGVKNLQALEAVLCRRHRKEQIRLSHNISRMLTYTEARGRMGREVHDAYTTCSKWTVNWRYYSSLGREDECDQFFRAVDTFLEFLQHNT